MVKKNLLFLLFVIFYISCKNDSKPQGDTPFSKCPYGAPKAIFSKEKTPKVLDQQFQLKEEFTLETVKFESGFNLELIQSGCEKPKQEFQFQVPIGTTAFTDTDWLNLAVELLGYCGNLTVDMAPLLMWQGALKESIEKVKLGEPFGVENHYFIQIDKVSGKDTGVLTITFFQN